MKRTEKRLRFCAVLLVLNLLFIWGNSLMPGSVSGAISGWIRDVLASIFHGRMDAPDAGHGLIRKLAHFMEFACLGALFTWLYAMLQKPVWLALACGGAAAVADESIQCFIPERGPSVRDVLIDSCGVMLGIGIVIAINVIFHKKKQFGGTIK